MIYLLSTYNCSLYLHLGPCVLSDQHIPYAGLGGDERRGFESVLDAKTECRKGAIFYLNKHLGIKIINLHTQKFAQILLKLRYIFAVISSKYCMQMLSRSRILVFLV